jgi:heparanase 1
MIAKSFLVIFLTTLGMNVLARDLKSSDLKGTSQSSSQEKNDVNLNFKKLKQVGEVDPRYQSFNIEMCEVIGGKFWIPYNLQDSVKKTTKLKGFAALKWGIPPINLYEKKLRMLASAIGPTYVRVSGTWANAIYFQDNNEPKLANPPAGYNNILTRAQWKGVIDFCKAVNGKLVTSFTISDGIRDKDGQWTPVELDPLLKYTKSIGGKIEAAELFNEPSHADHGDAPKGYNGQNYATDFAAFKKYVTKAAPDMKIIGPGSTGEGGILPDGLNIATESLLSANPKPNFEIFTYHYYGTVSKRCFGGQTPEKAMSQEWLARTEKGFEFYKGLRDKYNPGAPIWCTETAEAACGGNIWAATFTDSFRYLEQLGRLAKKGVQVVMHNTFATSEYALLDQEDHEPRPNYWAALLWSKLMGTKVYDAGLSVEGVDIFVHSLKNSKDGITAMIINPTNFVYSIKLPAAAEQYMFTADELQTKTVKLNGEVLKLKSDETLPIIKGKKVNAGELQLPVHSILFLTFKSSKF